MIVRVVPRTFVQNFMKIIEQISRMIPQMGHKIPQNDPQQKGTDCTRIFFSVVTIRVIPRTAQHFMRQD